MIQSDTWYQDGGNMFTQSNIDKMFAREIPEAAEANGFNIDFFEQALAYYQKQGKVMVVNQ